jgi:hypothetical protein
MNKRALAIVLAGLAFAQPAEAADVASSTSTAGKIIITLTGDIVDGDADKVWRAIKAAQDGGRLVSGIRLNSMGGKLMEAVKLADIVREASIATAVDEGADCASACFIVFAAGIGKFVHHGARIGVHGASDEWGEETVESGAATVMVARIVKELDVPTDIIGKMVVTPPQEMIWLAPDEVRSMGAKIVGGPALEPEKTARSLLPLPIQPSAQGKDPLGWHEVVDRTRLMSAQQNNGKPLSIRYCDRRTNRCSHSVVVKAVDDDRGDMVVNTLIDMAGRTLRRELCSFPKRGEIRVCVDWDTQVATRAVKDRHGKWVELADELLPGGR